MRLRGLTLSALAEPAGGRPRRLGQLPGLARLCSLCSPGLIERGCLSGAVLGALSSMDGGKVPRDVADDALAQVLSNERFMRFGRQGGARKLGKGPAERGLAGQWVIRFKAEQAAQHGVHRQSTAQLRSLLKAQDGLGDKSLSQCMPAALGRAAPLACVAQ